MGDRAADAGRSKPPEKPISMIAWVTMLMVGCGAAGALLPPLAADDRGERPAERRTSNVQRPTSNEEMASNGEMAQPFQSASADSPSATSFSWWDEGQLPGLGQPASSRLLHPVQTLRGTVSKDIASKDTRRSPAEAGFSNGGGHAVHPLKRVADGESAGSRLRLPPHRTSNEPAPPPSRRTTATAILGFPPGANATNHTSGLPGAKTNAC